jgi:hypothetical protein
MATSIRLTIAILVLVWGSAASGQETTTERGERMIDDYFRRQVKQISDACLSDIKSRADWEKRRPGLRRQFLEMLGLWPLPARTDLKATVTGKIEADRFTIEKVHFQSSPGLYVTGNLYLPKKAKLPAPAILYLCGHAKTVFDGVSYGHHVNYQHHPTWFAENGYACLIIDSLQLGEVQGLHHGTHNLGQWWWQTLGYTPAGVECWNAMRALDYLETRNEIDPKRIGVTGRSGGGAYSWWLAAADDRPQCIIPVAGIADLEAHLVEGIAPRFRSGVISGHCDCMYPINLYRWDFPQVAALCAPRPLLLANSDQDDIFPVPGYRRIIDRVRPIYELYDAGEKLGLLETTGPHKDTPELRRGAFLWMNRWLKGDDGNPKELTRAPFSPQQLKVLGRIPEDAANALIHETFIRSASTELPSVPAVVKEWWPQRSKEWLDQLQAKVFRGWPEKAPALAVKPQGDVIHDGLLLRAWDYTSEEGIDLRLWLLTAEKVERPRLVVVSAVDESGWHEFLSGLTPEFSKLLLVSDKVDHDREKFQQNRQMLTAFQWGFATVAPRGIGPTRWAKAGSREDTHIRRRFALIGQTLDGQRVWDVRRALAVLRQEPWFPNSSLGTRAPVWLKGRGDMAGIALYAALFEPDVARLDLWELPSSHRQGPTFLNVRRILDTPQAVALAFPRQVFVYPRTVEEARDWDWPLALQKTLGQEYLKVRTVKK